MKRLLSTTLAYGHLVASFLFCAFFLSMPSNPEQASQNASKITTGPAVGEKIPSFRTSDQYGRLQDFNSVRGPKGAIIVFYRSADW
jgi:hypothetical protein